MHPPDAPYPTPDRHHPAYLCAAKRPHLPVPLSISYKLAGALQKLARPASVRVDTQ